MWDQELYYTVNLQCIVSLFNSATSNKNILSQCLQFLALISFVENNGINKIVILLP